MMIDKKCGIAKLVDIVMRPRNVTVVIGAPGVGRTTLLVAMVRYAAKNGASVAYATDDETDFTMRRRFGGMSNEALLRLRVEGFSSDGDPFDRCLASDEDLVVLDRPRLPPHRFDDVLRVAKAPAFKAATIIAPSFTELTYPQWVAPEHTADVLLMLSREENRANVVVTVAKNRYGSDGQRFVFQFTQSGLAIPSIAEAT
jgi:predicted ATP-dependent serine protease